MTPKQQSEDALRYMPTVEAFSTLLCAMVAGSTFLGIFVYAVGVLVYWVN